ERRHGTYKQELAAGNPGFQNELAYHYRALQIFDLLSLYFCCDGYASDSQFKEYTIAPVRVAYDHAEEVELRIVPDGNAVRFDPYQVVCLPLGVVSSMCV